VEHRNYAPRAAPRKIIFCLIFGYLDVWAGRYGRTALTAPAASFVERVAETGVITVHSGFMLGDPILGDSSSPMPTPAAGLPDRAHSGGRRAGAENLRHAAGRAGTVDYRAIRRRQV
jgi:hypothetical protein